MRVIHIACPHFQAGVAPLDRKKRLISFSATFFVHKSGEVADGGGRENAKNANSSLRDLESGVDACLRLRDWAGMTHVNGLPIGTELVGDYRIDRVLGAGGFGITYLAEETALARKVTIKEYFPNDFAARGEAFEAVPRSQNSREDYQWGLDRFIEEAQTLAKFDHRNIVRVYRYFRLNNTGYMVLHFEEGQSLKGWLKNLGRAPRQGELDKIIAPLLDALAVIHDADFLHRDIAPDNIIIRTDGSPVLIDFGSARGEIAQHTRTISALVKPGYSPYEQYSETGKQQGPWTDIYALAATLYHAITGKRPPDAPSRVVRDEIKPAREAAISAYRSGFLKAIDRGLAIDIDRRPQSVAAWRGDLLAPESNQRRWFGRGPETGAAGEDGIDEGVVDDAAAGEVDVAAAPPPPDAPGRQGRLVDFIEGLKKPAPAAAPAAASAAAAPASAAGVAEDVAPRKAPAAKTGPKKSNGLAGLFAVAERAEDAPRTKPAAKKPAEGAGRLLVPLPSTPLQPVKRRPPRPKPIRSGRRSWWRPLAFKLMIGLGVASFAVAYQDRFPKLELRGLGTISSATRPVPDLAEASQSRSGQESDSSSRRARAPIPTLLIRRFKAHAPGTTFARFTKRGEWLVTTGAEGALKLWSAGDGHLIRTLEMDDGPATALAVYGTQALTGHSEGTIALWDLEQGRKLGSFKRNDARIWSLAFQTPPDAGGRADPPPPRRFFAASHDWTITAWEVRTPSAPLHVFEGHKNAVQVIAYEGNNGLIASGGADKTVQLWNISTFSRVRTYRRERDFITALDFSPDGRWLAAGLLDGRIRVYSTQSRRRVRSFNGHDGAVSSLRFLGDGDHLLSASKDGTARLWALNRRRVLRTFGSQGVGLDSTDVTPTNDRLATSAEDGSITLWRVGRLSARPRRRHR